MLKLKPSHDWTPKTTTSNKVSPNSEPQRNYEQKVNEFTLLMRRKQGQLQDQKVQLKDQKII